MGIIFESEVTNEGIVNVLQQCHTLYINYTPLDRLEGFHFRIADWHAGVKFLSVRIKFAALRYWYMYHKHIGKVLSSCTLLGLNTIEQ